MHQVISSAAQKAQEKVDVEVKKATDVAVPQQPEKEIPADIKNEFIKRRDQLRTTMKSELETYIAEMSDPTLTTNVRRFKSGIEANGVKALETLNWVEDQVRKNVLTKDYVQIFTFGI